MRSTSGSKPSGHAGTVTRGQPGARRAEFVRPDEMLNEDATVRAPRGCAAPMPNTRSPRLVHPALVALLAISAALPDMAAGCPDTPPPLDLAELATTTAVGPLAGSSAVSDDGTFSYTRGRFRP